MILRDIITNRIFPWSLILGNLLGAFFGFAWWYGPQLAATPWYLWIFVPDCPLYALLFAIVFAWMLSSPEKQGGIFTFLVSVGLLKYGLWTVASQVFVFFTNRSYVTSNYGVLIMAWLVISHIIMFAESSLLLKRMRPVAWSWVGAALAWFLLNDYLDYAGFPGFGTTITYLPGGSLFFMVVAIVAALLFPIAARWYAKKR